jgi:hypothetical protein
VVAIGRNGIEIATAIAYGIGKGSDLNKEFIHIPEDAANGNFFKLYIGEDGIDFHFFCTPFLFLSIV